MGKIGHSIQCVINKHKPARKRTCKKKCKTNSSPGAEMKDTNKNKTFIQQNLVNKCKTYTKTMHT